MSNMLFVDSITQDYSEHLNDYHKKTLSDLFQPIIIKAFADGENAHTLPIILDVLKKGAYTVYNQPILWKYNKYLDDAMGHEIDEVPCGFVPYYKDNPITYKEENGKTYLIIKALLWARYAPKIVEIFERDKTKGVSVEINCQAVERLDGDEVTDYVISGITIIGDMFNPAVKGCKSELLKFTEDKNKYLADIDMNNTIKINNSAESAVDGKWENPRRRLFNPIVKSNNSKSLLREAYLIIDDSKPTLSNCKYPHHIIKNGELVLHIQGVKSAFARIQQQDAMTDDIKKHLLKHYKELGLNQENFAEFGLTSNEFSILFTTDKGGVEKMGYDMSNESYVASIKDILCAQSNVECTITNITDKVVEYTFTKDDKLFKFSADVEMSECDGEIKYSISNEKEVEDEIKLSYEELEKKCTDLESKCSELESKNEEMSNCINTMTEEKEQQDKAFNELKTQSDAYMSQIEAMSDYEELKKFKAEMTEKIEQEERMSEMNKVFTDIASKGITITDNDKQELIKKFADYENVEMWTNYVKAFAFDNTENIDGIVRIAYPDNNTINNTGSIWDSI